MKKKIYLKITQIANNKNCFLKNGSVLLILVLGISLILTTNAKAQTGDTTTGLIGWWKLNEISGTVAMDSSINVNTGDSNGDNGTIDGACNKYNDPIAGFGTGDNIYSTPGKLGGTLIEGVLTGGAFFFNPSSCGEEFVQVPNTSGVLNFQKGSFSYSEWIYPVASTHGWEVPLYTSSYGIVCTWASQCSSAFETISDGTNTINVNFGPKNMLNTWTLLTVVINRTDNTVKTYEDGVYTGNSASISALGAINTGDIQIGEGGNSEPYSGAVSDVRVYNRALTEADVQALYALGAGTASLNISLDPSSTGSGTVTGGTINCGSNCTQTVNEGSSITLTATAASSEDYLSSWGYSGCGPASLTAINSTPPYQYQCTIPMNNDLTFAIKFRNSQAESTVITAVSCGVTDIQNAINSASNGNTILIPPGNCTWSNVINVNKPVILSGSCQLQSNPGVNVPCVTTTADENCLTTSSTYASCQTTSNIGGSTLGAGPSLTTITMWDPPYGTNYYGTGYINITAPAEVGGFTINDPGYGGAISPFATSGSNGWRITDVNYTNTYSNYMIFTVSGITTPPATNAVYTNNSNTFTVVSTNLSGTAGSMAGTILTIASGTPSSTVLTLIKSSGTGDSSITFSGHNGTNAGYFVAVNTYGVIDSSTVNGGGGEDELIFARGPANSWQTGNSLGGTDNLFIEDSIFNDNGYVTDCNANSRCVVRFNLITSTGSMKVDGHGMASNSPPRGIREIEVYNNFWTNETGQAMELRGGTGRVFNNTANHAAWLILNDYCANGGSFPNCGTQEPVDNPSSGNDLPNYPVTDQLGVGEDPKAAHSEPMYLWLNKDNVNAPWPIDLGDGSYTYPSTYSGVTMLPSSGVACTLVEIQANKCTVSDSVLLEPVVVADQDYFSDVTTFGAVGVSIGTTAEMNAMTPSKQGYGWWVTDQGSWNANVPANTSGVLYVWNGSAWVPNYTPYTFPHPLRSQQWSYTYGNTTPPAVGLETDNSSYTTPGPVILTANASSPIGASIAKVAFYAVNTSLPVASLSTSSILLGTCTPTSPSPCSNNADTFTYTWNGALPGTYTLSAIAYDSNGNSTTSAATSITVYVSEILNVSIAGKGFGEVFSSDNVINCGVNPAPPPDICTESVNSGTVITLTASPATGSTFGGWSGACSGTGSCIVTMNAQQNVTADFAANTVNGQCGSAAQTYLYNSTSFGSNALCKSGNPNPSTVAFPSPGSLVRWTCVGSNNGFNSTCTAKRNPRTIIKLL